MKLDFRQRLLTSTLLVGAGMLANPAYAQTAPAPAAAPPAPAAQPAAPAAQVGVAPSRTAAPSSQEIIITGTRIPQPNLTSAAPITVVTNQDVKLSGATRVEDVLNSLPSVQANQSSGVSNGATGTAYVDLRDLGPKRTLVLINGRRLLPGDPNSAAQAADINFIPGSLIKRVDVLTGGASSVYGADAVAGVVNFIMDSNFTGVRFDGQYGFYQHNNNCPSIPTNVTPATVCGVLNARINQGLQGYSYPSGSVADGGQFDGTVSMGAAFDDNRGHAMAYFGYRKVNPVLQQRRDYSACALQDRSNSTKLATRNHNIQCGGSLTNRTGTVIFFTQTTKNGAATSTVGGLGAGTISATAGPRFNFNPTNYYQRPDERYVGGAFADYEISKAVHPYMEFMFMDDHTVAQIAPSGDFGNTLVVNCDNPLLGAQQVSTLCQPANLIVGTVNGFPVASGAPYAGSLGFPRPNTPETFFGPTGLTYNEAFAQILRRNVEGGNRAADLKHTEWRGVLGTRGDLSKVWSYDAYFQYGRTDYSQIYKNELSARRLVNALNAVSVLNGKEVAPNTPGSTIECRSVLAGTDINCVPIDYFTGAGPSAAALNYVSANGLIIGTTSEQVADANMTGALGEMGVQTPWADEGVGVNFGAEYRKESLDLNPDNEFVTGDLTGQGAATLPVSGSYRVLEGFGEVQIPIIRHSFIEDLSLAAGYRKSYYKLGTGRTYNTDTYKLSAEFAPVKDIRFRGAFNRAVRAPNIQELFAPNLVALDASTDPCAGRTITATDFGCIAQGMTVGSKTPENPAAQYNGFVGGNVNLNPEKATTKTLGVVLQPRFVPRLAITADWYDIKVKNAIRPFGADAILANCVNSTTATSVAPSCALIHRAPGGSLWLSALGFVTDLPHNVGSVETKGIDGNVSYSYRFGSFGTLSANVVGTWLNKFLVNDGLNPTYNCAGFYGATCGNPLPHWRHKARLSLQMPNGIGISAQWRYVGKVTHQCFSSDVVLNCATIAPGANGVAQLDGHVPAQSYFDLAGTFTVGDHYSLRMGVNNIFDKNPPLFSNANGACAVATCNGNTYGGTYDALGRFLFVGATLNF